VLSDIAVNRGQRERAAGHLDRAAALVADLEVSRSKAYVLGHVARFHMLDRRNDKAIDVGRQALDLVDELDLEELRPHVLNTIGTARAQAGDSAGVDDLERSIELALGLNAVADVLRGYNNLAGAVAALGDMRRYRKALEDGLQAADGFGERIPAQALRGNLPFALFVLGDWDEALRFADEFIAEVEGGRGSRQASVLFEVRSEIRLARDDVTGALSDARAAVEHNRLMASIDAADALLALARALLESGSPDDAERVTAEALALADLGEVDDAALLHRLGRDKEARLVLERVSKTRWREAAAHELRGELVQAAQAYSEIGHMPEEAHLRLKAAEQLLAQGRRAEADAQLTKALAFYRSVGASRYIRQCEELLAASA
jgi:tetratricopeptide (TPR) repeat protein